MTFHLTKPNGNLQLKKGREKLISNRHPWLYSGAIYAVTGDPRPGDLVTVTKPNGKIAAIAYYNPESQIHGRILSWGPEEALSPGFWRKQIERARDGRSLLALADTNSYRLIHGESDRLPGLVVDVYNTFLVAQVSTLGIDVRKDSIFKLLMGQKLPHSGEKPTGLIERSDLPIRAKEGLEEVRRIATGDTPPKELIITENGRQFIVNLLEGHKTGFYLDQRDNRALLSQARFVADKDILNTFAYNGAFAAYCAAAKPNHIVNIDSSADAIALAERNVLLNAPDRADEKYNDKYLVGDVFETLRRYRDSGRQFDVVILDPPKFANNQREIAKASRAYKDINLLAMKILRPGGLLMSFSCSGSISTDLFQKILFGAAVDAKRDVQILQNLSAGGDHPTALNFPESSYLKGHLCRVW